MSTNLSHFQTFSSSKQIRKNLGIVDKEPIFLTDESMSTLSEISVKNINIFLTSINTLGEARFHRSELLFLLLVNNSYSYEYLSTSNEQERYYPTNLALRNMYKCTLTQRSSKSDKLRMHFEKRGYLETSKVPGSSRSCVKFTEKFFLTFQIWSLKEIKKSLLENNLLSQMNKSTLEKIKQAEIKICQKKELLEKLKMPDTTKNTVKNL